MLKVLRVGFQQKLVCLHMFVGCIRLFVHLILFEVVFQPLETMGWIISRDSQADNNDSTRNKKTNIKQRKIKNVLR